MDGHLRTRNAAGWPASWADRQREHQGQGRLPQADEQALGAKLVNDALEAHAHDRISRGAAPPTAADEQALHAEVFNLLFGLGRLQDHLDRPDVVNIHAAGAEPVWLDLTDGTSLRGRRWPTPTRSWSSSSGSWDGGSGCPSGCSTRPIPASTCS